MIEKLLSELFYRILRLLDILGISITERDK